jgi:putative SOS response-associated peptidase YedK
MAAIYTNDEHVMLLTREAVGDSSKIHHRMPVLLEDDEEVDIWLDTDNYTFEMAIEKAMRPEKKVWNEILTQRLGPAVNNVREKSAKCIMSYEDY